MAEKLFIPILLGTNRQERQSEKVANFILAEMQKYNELETQLFDARDFQLPADGYGESIKDNFPEWRDAITRADGLIIVSPEYNHGYPGVLKSILDLLLAEYYHKAVGLVGVSSGILGGARMIENLLPVVRELGLVASKVDFIFPQVRDMFTEENLPKDEKVKIRGEKFFKELIWLTQSLRDARMKTK